LTEEIFSFAGGFLRGGCDESESSDVFCFTAWKTKGRGFAGGAVSDKETVINSV